MLVRDQHPISPPHAVNLPNQAPAFRFKGKCQPLSLALTTLDFNVQTPAGVYSLIRHAQVFHLFEVEEPLAIPQGMQSHNTEWFDHYADLFDRLRGRRFSRCPCPGQIWWL